ncbi:MAG: nucleotidyl transferase AbiEii/AbiGii toxin family protein [Actinomycetota bacterium]|nr:nucleotidyl transferase AbiEii/AbiGii toxin family protein [Actinomycetota bacterium]
MRNWTAPKAIECFHLAFLAALRTKVPQDWYVLKGGSNLRYFYGSQRYSEDIDLDVVVRSPQSLEDGVDGALKLVLAIVRASGIAIDLEAVRKPKQTDTTRRWKVPLIVPGFPEPVRTKVEFSNRNGERRYKLETVPAQVASPYGIAPPLVQRYMPPAAVKQKVLALALRNETQARDVFDLDLLFRGHRWSSDDVAAEVRADAADAAAALTFDVFKDQVLPFLDSEVAVLYDEYAWDGMQTSVIEELLRETA